MATYHNNPIKVISRESPLALLQVQEVFGLLPGLGYELISTKSFGDKHKEISLLDNPPADLFTRELDHALIDGTAQVAIHSAKDLPYPLHPALEVIALTEATDQSDSLVSRHHLTLQQLPAGAKIGTSSPMRKKEVLALRPDLEIVSIRGTIEERIALVDKGTIDALIVATCALARLGLSHRIAQILPFETHPLQGHLAIVATKNNPLLKSLFAPLDIRPHFGHVTLVGFSPGTPALLTLGGDKALANAGIIFHDDLIDMAFLDRYQAKKVYVGKRKNKHSFEQKSINRLLLDAAKEGRKVVRLKGGDPMVFAHGGEEVAYLQSNFVPVHVIPGVSSGIAVSSLSKIPLTHREIASSVAFFTGHSATVGIPQADTLVCYMGGANISAISERLLARGWEAKTPVLLVYNVSRPDEREFFSTLGALSQSSEQYPTPVIIVIGEVVSLRSQPAPQIKKQRTLFTGTNPIRENQQDEWLHHPLIEIRKIEKNRQLREAIKSINQFQWIIFTSRYTVQFFFEELKALQLDARHLAGVKIAAVGKVSAAQLAQYGISADLIPEEESSEGLLAAIMQQQIAPSKVLIPRSDLGLAVLPQGLEHLGWKVQAIPVYHNVLPHNVQAVNIDHFEQIIFTSPSTVSNFLQLYGHFPAGKQYTFRGNETRKRFEALSKNPISTLKTEYHESATTE